MKAIVENYLYVRPRQSLQPIWGQEGLHYPSTNSWFYLQAMHIWGAGIESPEVVFNPGEGRARSQLSIVIEDGGSHWWP